MTTKTCVVPNISCGHCTSSIELELTDLALLMSVNPGFGGQKFIPGVLPKIEAVRAMVDASPHDIEIEVDGGVAPATTRAVKDAGANVLVAGSAVFGAESYRNAIEAIRTG